MRGKLSAGALALAMAVAVVVPSDASAQDWGAWKFDIGIKGGYAWFSDMLDEDEVPTTLAEDDIHFEAGWLAGATLGYWFTDRIGLRANFDYTERPLVHDNVDVLDDEESNNLAEDINLWHGTGDLMFRFTDPTDKRFVPYIALGAGGTWVDPAVINFNVGDTDGLLFTTSNGTPLVLEDSKKLTGLVALGSDIRLGRNIGLRLEVGDRLFDGPLASPVEPAVGDNIDVGKLTHEVYGTFGLMFLMGVEERPAVAVAPAPPPAPAPAPPAPPAEEAVTVCLVDPGVPTGLRTVNAIYIPSQGDTLVVVNGQRVPLDQAGPDVMLAAEADWFVRGEPVSFMVGPQRYEFVNYGTTRMIAADQLAFIGTFRGVPVYANASEVADIGAELNALRTAPDLEAALEARADLREEMEDLTYLYVPVATTGCVFQPLQRVQEVRKVRG